MSGAARKGRPPRPARHAKGAGCASYRDPGTRAANNLTAARVGHCLLAHVQYTARARVHIKLSCIAFAFTAQLLCPAASARPPKPCQLTELTVRLRPRVKTAVQLALKPAWLLVACWPATHSPGVPRLADCHQRPPLVPRAPSVSCLLLVMMM